MRYLRVRGVAPAVACVAAAVACLAAVSACIRFSRSGFFLLAMVFVAGVCFYFLSLHITA